MTPQRLHLTLQALTISEIHAYFMKILVPTDFSETSVNAAKYAIQLTSQHVKAEIILYHSYSILHLSGVPMPILPEDRPAFRKRIFEELTKIRDQFAHLTPATTTVSCEADELPLTEGMQEIIDVRSINLVIMGITGKSGIQKALIGSNTLAATEKINIPIIIVPETATYSPLKNVVFAYNRRQPLLSRQSNAIEDFTAKVNAHLDVLYIGEEQHLNAAKQDIQKLLHISDIAYHTIKHHDTAKDILAFADTNNADLLLALPGKYGFLQDLFHKSITKQLAYKTKVPLMVIS